MRLEFVKNEPKYWEFIRGLRNDGRVKYGFIQQEEIRPEQHVDYMMSHGQCFHLCLVDDKPAGFIRVLAEDIGVCTHPDFQKRGVGKFMVNEIMQLYPDAVAKIKLENKASIKLFESCGFVKKYYLLEKEAHKEEA
jgi:ribosomal protein S18 acetylase RimI-like enzyme